MSSMIIGAKGWSSTRVSHCPQCGSSARSISYSNGVRSRSLYAATMALSLSVMTLPAGPRGRAYVSTTSSLGTHNRTPISSEPTKLFFTAGSVNIYLKRWMKFSSMQPSGFGFTITSDRTKPMAENRR